MAFLRKVLHSFIPASQGIVSGFRERNMKAHGIITTLMVLAGIVLGLSLLEWLIIFLLIAFVLSAELFNTGIEELANLMRDELKLSYEATRRARDVAAGAVLVRAVAAAIIGTVIFLPRILALFV